MSRITPYSTTNKSIGELLRCLIVIPMNQREYSWTKKEIILVLNDIKELFEGTNDRLLMGSVIVYINQNSNRIKEIYDGQQRTITLILTLLALGEISKTTTNTNNEKIYNLLKATDILLNVSVIDCQPMTNLEALAFNVPSLSGPLFLNELSRYEYTKITTVDNPLNTYEISKKIDDLLKIPINDMNEIMMNYSTGLKKIALKRYAEFLEI
jgi:glycosyltransferase involved in cell wall biosynthesis